MNTIFSQMLKQYDERNPYDMKNAVKEIMQEIVLCGLSRAGFLKKLLFMGAQRFVFSTALIVFRRIWIFL